MWGSLCLQQGRLWGPCRLCTRTNVSSSLTISPGREMCPFWKPSPELPTGPAALPLLRKFHGASSTEQAVHPGPWRWEVNLFQKRTGRQNNCRKPSKAPPCVDAAHVYTRPRPFLQVYIHRMCPSAILKVLPAPASDTRILQFSVSRLCGSVPLAVCILRFGDSEHLPRPGAICSASRCLGQFQSLRVASPPLDS